MKRDRRSREPLAALRRLRLPELEVAFERANRKCTLTGGDDACHLAVEGS